MNFKLSIPVLYMHYVNISVRELCGGVLEGGEFGSTEIVFRPGPLLGGQFYADTKSAGAICLLGENCARNSLFRIVADILE